MWFTPAQLASSIPCAQMPCTCWNKIMTIRRDLAVESRNLRSGQILMMTLLERRLSRRLAQSRIRQSKVNILCPLCIRFLHRSESLKRFKEIRTPYLLPHEMNFGDYGHTYLKLQSWKEKMIAEDVFIGLLYIT